MIDHITIEVGDLAKSKLFYERAFAPLGYSLSFGKESVFWAFDVGKGCLFEIQRTGETPPLTHLHVAFRVKSKAEVDAFYRAALEAGAADNGAPGAAPGLCRALLRLLRARSRRLQHRGDDQRGVMCRRPLQIRHSRAEQGAKRRAKTLESMP